MTSARKYDVALSFAGEDRQIASRVAEALDQKKISVFYDEYEKAGLWGMDLYAHLADVYGNQARYVIVFLSHHYATKLWTNHERKSAQARAFSERKEFILPIRLDDTEIEGIARTVGYLRMPPESPASIVKLVEAKLKAHAEGANNGASPAAKRESRQSAEGQKWRRILTPTLPLVVLGVLALFAVGNWNPILNALTSYVSSIGRTAQANPAVLEFVRVDKPIAEGHNSFRVRFVVRNRSEEPLAITKVYVTPNEVIKHHSELAVIGALLGLYGDDEITVEMSNPRPGIPIAVPLTFALDAKATREFKLHFIVTFSKDAPSDFEIPATLTLEYDDADVTSKTFLLSTVPGT